MIGVVGLTGALFFVFSSSDESESEDESFFLALVRLAGGGIAAFGVTIMTRVELDKRNERNVPLVGAGFFAGASSSSESLLLDEAAFFAGCLATGVGLAGDFFCTLPSSDESESEDESFFFLLAELDGGGTAALFVAAVTVTTHQTMKIETTNFSVDLLLVGVDGGCFLLAGVATSSESELLDDDAALRFGVAFAGGAIFAFTTGFFVSSSDESEEDDESFFFFLIPFVTETFVGSIAPCF